MSGAVQQVYLDWLKLRAEQIHRSVSVFDVLSRNGISLSGRAESFSCPFHGKDERPSAKAFPEDAKSRSHVWCFVCNERWDAIAIQRKFGGGKDVVKFSQAMSELEQAFGIDRPPMPDGAFEAEAGPDQYEGVDRMIVVFEARLRLARDAYGDDMRGFLVASTLLDKVRHHVGKGSMPAAQGEAVLKQALEKVGDRIRNHARTQGPNEGDGPDPDPGDLGDERAMGAGDRATPNVSNW